MSISPGDPSQIATVSEDGKWRWDGQTWQSTEPPSAPAMIATPTPAPAGKRVYGLGRITLVVIAAMLFSGVCGLVVGGASANSTSNHSTSSASPSPSAKASAVTTTSNHDLAVAYATVVQRDVLKVEAALGAMGTGCGGGDVPACRKAMVNVGSEDRAFLADLGKLEVPACLAAANDELATAIELEVDATTEAIAGIDGNDATKVSDGANLITLSTTHLTKADALIKAETC